MNIFKKKNKYVRLDGSKKRDVDIDTDINISTEDDKRQHKVKDNQKITPVPSSNYKNYEQDVKIDY